MMNFLQGCALSMSADLFALLPAISNLAQILQKVVIYILFLFENKQTLFLEFHVNGQDKTDDLEYESVFEA